MLCVLRGKNTAMLADLRLTRLLQHTRVGDKGISGGIRAAGGSSVMNLRKMWEVSHKLRHHLSSTPAGGRL